MRTKEEILQGQSEEDFMLTCRVNLKTWASRMLGWDVQPFHEEMLSLVRQHKRLAITAPTGFGKSTMLGITYPLWMVTFKPEKEVLVISKTLNQSSRIMEAIKKCINGNEILKELIPESKDIWTQKEINVSTGGKIFCRPYNINLKGLHVDYILLDEAASYENPIHFFDFVLTRAVSREGTIAAISTPEHPTDLMEQLRRPTSGFYNKVYKAIQDDGTLLWPSKFTQAKLDEIRMQQGDALFRKNYLCDPRAPAENALYPPYIVFNCFDEKLRLTPHTEGHTTVLGADFAIASGPNADFDCYIVVERIGEKVIMRHGEIHKGFSIPAKVRRLHDLYNMYKPVRMKLDPSQVGHGVISDLRELALPVEAGNFAPASRSKMLIDLRKLMGDPNSKPPIESRLIIPRDPNSELTMTFTDRLIGELFAFQETKTRTGILTYQSKAKHDDTVMALALACEGATSQRPMFEDEIFMA